MVNVTSSTCTPSSVFNEQQQGISRQYEGVVNDTTYHNNVFYMDHGLPLLRPTLESLLMFNNINETALVACTIACPVFPREKHYFDPPTIINNNDRKQLLLEIIDDALLILNSA